MRSIFTVILFMTFIFYGYGQQRGQLSGKLVDSVSRQALSLATITVFNASDTSIISYRMSDPKGEFRVTGIPLNLRARVIVSYSGYLSYRQEFSLTADSSELLMGTIAMVNSPESLEEVVIVAERPPVIVRNDTIEFNASAFKTLPTALVEDLLKKLPGVQIDGDGNVMVNGRRVNRILVDGKTFFGDDPKMATRNLPANLIDKVQVADDKEDIDRAIDGDLTNVGKVINLSLKKGVKKGWFGKVYGGGGTQDRYELGGIANIFRDTMQLSILGYSNNINKSGFSMRDVQQLGGFGRSGTSSISISGSSGFSLNGISFGGLDAGISRSSGVGFNLNHAPTADKTFFLQYFYGESRARVEELTNEQQFISDTIIDTRNDSRALVLNNSHIVNAGLRLRPDSLSNMRINAGFSMADNRQNRFLTTRVANNKLGLLTDGSGRLNNGTDDKAYNHDIWYSRRSRIKRGRTLDLSHYFNYRDNLQEFLTEQTNTFFIPVTDTLLFEQLRVQDVPDILGTMNANFTEPLGQKFSLRISQNLRFQREKQLVTTFENAGNGKYDLIIDQLSDGFHRNQFRSSSTLALTYKFKNLNFTAGMNALYQDIRNNFVKSDLSPDMTLFDILPNFSISWKKFSVRYMENVQAPAINYMNPVPDNSNPYQIRLANPKLKPSHSREIYANYFNFFPNKSLNLSFYLNGGFTDDHVILARTINDRGVQTTMPINVSGSQQFNSSASVSKEFKNDTRFIFSTNARIWLNTRRQMLMVNDKLSRSDNFSISPSLGVGLNYNDIIEIRPEYRFSVNETRYTDPFFKNLDVLTHFLSGELVVRWPKKLVWETNYNYRRNSEVAIGMPKSSFLWNAGLTVLMMKEDRAQLKLSVYDILKSNNSFYRTVSQNFITDRHVNILQRYFMLSFTYNIRTGGSQRKVGGTEKFFFF